MKSHEPTGYWTGCVCESCKTMQAEADHRRTQSVNKILIRKGIVRPGYFPAS